MKKIIPLLLTATLVSSCFFDKPLSFENKLFTSENFEYCNLNNCPSINVRYLNAINNDKKSALVNEAINKQLIGIIASSRDNLDELANVEEAVNQFINDFRKYEAEFGNDFLTYDIDVFMQVSYQSENLLSIETNYYVFTGGAHGYSGTSFLNFDAKTGEPLTNNMLFPHKEALLGYCEEKFREVYQIPKGRNINSTGFWFENDRFHLPENIGFTETEIILHYNQYEIASYAEGPVILPLPRAEITEFLQFQ